MKKIILVIVLFASITIPTLYFVGEIKLSEAFFSGLAVTFGIVPFWTYALSILEWHKTGNGTQPTKVTLLIWATLDVFIFVSYLITNGWNIMTYMLLSYVIGAVSITYLAIKYGSWGVNKKERRESFTVLAGAIIGTIAWVIFQSASIGHYLFIVTLLISVLPLIKKIYRQPHTEDLKSWFLWFVANNITLYTTIKNGWTVENGLLTSVYFVLYIVILIPLIRFYLKKRK
jgi:hypothetical protein